MLWARAQRKWSLWVGRPQCIFLPSKGRGFPILAACLTSSLLRSRTVAHAPFKPSTQRLLLTHTLHQKRQARRSTLALAGLSNSCATLGGLPLTTDTLLPPLHTPHSTARTQSPTLPRESCRRYRCPHQHYHNARAVLARARSFSCSDWPSFLTSLPPSSSSSLRRRVRFPCPPPPSCGGQRCAEERIVGPLFSVLRSRT
jgi:hypothetical protein